MIRGIVNENFASQPQKNIRSRKRKPGLRLSKVAHDICQLNNIMSDDFICFPEETPKPVSAALKRAQSLVGTSEGRPENDFYPTPPEAVEALLSVESFSGSIWEPACGDGAICKVLEAHGHKVLATDLIDRGWGEAPHDFLTSSYRADNIITNPPFKLAETFINLSLERSTGKVAMLCKLQFLEGAKRKQMFENTPLKMVYVFSKRLTMTRNGEKMANGGMICFAWFVFEHGYQGKPMLSWL